MSEIAFNMNGEPFDLPPTSAAWRVRKLKPKGAPEVVYGRDGLPLFLALDADIEDLRREAAGDGRYRLDPVDDHHRPLPNAQSSYVCVHPIERAPEPAAPTAPAPKIQADMAMQLVGALLESQKQHTELARMYVSTFPVLVGAVSGVVSSAGDAGLPTRVPLVVPIAPEIKPADTKGDAAQEDEEEDDQDEEGDEEEVEVVEIEPEPEWSWPKVAATVVERFSPQIDALLGQLPALSATLGARRAQRAASDKPTEQASGTSANDVTSHLNAILAALTTDEATAVKALADELPMVEKLAYFQTLRGKSVPEAVAYVRGELARLGRNSARGAAGPSAEEATMPGVEMSDAQIDAHIGAIRAAMTPEESETVRVMLEELVFEHRRIWVEKLCQMSVPQGVAFLREKLAGARRDASAQSAVGPRVVRVARAAPSSAAPHATAPPTTPRPSAPDKPRRDGRRAAGPTAPSASPPATPTAPSGGAPTGGLGMISPNAQAHLDAIQSALTAEEDMAVRSYLAALSAAARTAWITALLSLPVPEAVAMIRAQRPANRASAAPEADLTRTADRASATPSDDMTPTAVAVATETGPRNAASMTTEIPPAAAIGPASAERATEDAEPSALAPALETPESSAPTAPATPPPVAEAPPAATSLDAAPSVAPHTAQTNADAHLLAIELALSAGERLRAHAMVAQMSPDDRELLLDQLLSASVPHGAALLRRATIQGSPAPTPPADAGTEVAHAADAHALGERSALDDAETLDDAEPIDEDDAPDPDSPATDERPDEEGELEDEQSDERPELAGTSAADHRTAIAPAVLPGADVPTLPPEAFPHFRAIDAELTFAERMRVFELAAQLSAAELRTWMRELTALPVAEAVAKVRAALAAADVASQSAKKGDVP